MYGSDEVRQVRVSLLQFSGRTSAAGPPGLSSVWRRLAATREMRRQFWKNGQQKWPENGDNSI